MRSIIKLMIAALVLHATWRSGTVYYRYYMFKNGVHQAAQFSGALPEGELRNQVVELAQESGVPLNPDAIQVRRMANHTIVEAPYTDEIEILPSYRYPWQFIVKVDTYTIVPQEAK
jgi:hypothetical protein